MYHFSGLFLFIVITLFSNGIYAHSVAKQASAFIISPKNNAVLNNPVKIKFGVKGILIAPAGVNKHKAGHYHLLVDVTEPISLDDPIPRNQNHIHFDQGELETTIKLSPGKHSLQLVVADEEHEPFEELISKKITIQVTKE
jgi:hypothetical protein